MCHSEIKMCKEYNLDMEQKPLKMLGVTFTGEVFNIKSKIYQIRFEKILLRAGLNIKYLIRLIAW